MTQAIIHKIPKDHVGVDNYIYKNKVLLWCVQSM
jgi:hypothetical protein